MAEIESVAGAAAPGIAGGPPSVGTEGERETGIRTTRMEGVAGTMTPTGVRSTWASMACPLPGGLMPRPPGGDTHHRLPPSQEWVHLPWDPPGAGEG